MNDKASVDAPVTGRRWNVVLAGCAVGAVAFTMFGVSPGVAESQESATSPAPPLAGEKVVDPAETLRAVDEAKQIWSEVLEIDRNGDTYSADIVDRILQFYRYGVGSKERPGDPRITRKFCRAYVLGRLQELFSAEAHSDGQPGADPEGPQNPLDEESSIRFRTAVTEILRTAFEDLTFPLRLRLFKLAEVAFSVQDVEAIGILHTLSDEAGQDTEEGNVILDTIERIEFRSRQGFALRLLSGSE